MFEGRSAPTAASILSLIVSLLSYVAAASVYRSEVEEVRH
jgi:hypothetical protein